MEKERERLRITVARLKKGGSVFEVIIDPKLAFEYLQDEDSMDVSEILTAPDVYSDAQNGKRAAGGELKKAFGTDDEDEVARTILEEGEVQLSAEQRAQIRERKHRRVIDSIARRAVDPRSGSPHPPARIEAALDEARFRIRESDSVEKNVHAAIDSIRAILPLRIETKTYRIVAAPQHAGRVLSALASLGEIKGQEWGAQGSLTLTIDVPAGLRDELYRLLNEVTRGDIDIHETK